MELTTKQTELLFEAAEIHQEWYKLYYPNNYPGFDVLLELNHTKLGYIIEGLTSDEITEKIKELKSTYKDLIDNETNEDERIYGF